MDVVVVYFRGGKWKIRKGASGYLAELYSISSSWVVAIFWYALVRSKERGLLLVYILYEYIFGKRGRGRIAARGSGQAHFEIMRFII